jgi:hypothetical protein
LFTIANGLAEMEKVLFPDHEVAVYEEEWGEV